MPLQTALSSQIIISNGMFFTVIDLRLFSLLLRKKSIQMILGNAQNKGIGHLSRVN